MKIRVGVSIYYRHLNILSNISDEGLRRKESFSMGLFARITTNILVKDQVRMNDDEENRGEVHLTSHKKTGEYSPVFYRYFPIGQSNGDRKSTRLNSSHVSISYA